MLTTSSSSRDAVCTVAAASATKAAAARASFTMLLWTRLALQKIPLPKRRWRKKRAFQLIFPQCTFRMEAPLLHSESSGEETVLRVEGMMAATCTAKVGQALKAVPGVTDVAVSLDEHQARVKGSPVDPNLLIKAVNATGKIAMLVEPGTTGVQQQRVELQQGPEQVVIEASPLVVQGVVVDATTPVNRIGGAHKGGGGRQAASLKAIP